MIVIKPVLRADFPLAQPHFVLFVKRESKAAGMGVLNGAELTEHGMHDIRPGVDGSPRGYRALVNGRVRQ